ncbi:hypothetical protein EVAR_68814_1 [Eumeta japonica]|uniref:Uncharacterized protein n=1 Tax=Eumeta variegata TaxID=151549 RepID=A0A4C1Z1F4_EUMVA|nr:hypothetical protein EVAR_68814_1 [Eumeta japonica]
MFTNTYRRRPTDKRHATSTRNQIRDLCTFESRTRELTAPEFEFQTRELRIFEFGIPGRGFRDRAPASPALTEFTRERDRGRARGSRR